MALPVAAAPPVRRGPLPWLLLRLGGVVFVLWAVATVTFFAIRLIPGDPAEAVLGGPGSQASAAALAQVRADYGLDLPLPLQYLHYLGRLAAGDLGRSYSLREPVGAVIGQNLGGTLLLALLSLLTAAVIALALAAWSTRGGRWASAVTWVLEVVSAALPHFWLAISLILLFSTTLGWLPPVSVPGPAGLVLPVLTLAIPLAGFLGQVMRESLLDALGSPFVLAARARGESEAGVFWRHALRHAAIPAIGLAGWAFGALISGAVVVETIFARPGIGRSLLSAVQLRDVPLVIGVVLVVALGYMLVTTLTDLADRLIDPRPAPTTAHRGRS
ncbi:ABC transporter permease [Lacisediminihabitans profunda]|uniref:ABC transporter permease n=1 Tax=Lacisediminihabitans profunda TaxID=2594790 RepID=A0A5C8US46_9MICO|nr:ABC transporter permease [Lacisediminihabitans profunda]